MSDYRDSDPENEVHEAMYAPNERYNNNDRPRPMTTADYNYEASKHQEKRYIPQGYGPAQKFPVVGGSYRAVSAKPYAQNTKMVSPKGNQTNQTVRFTDMSGEKKPTFALQTNKLVHSLSNDITKITPKNIPQDKERLYEETLHLKQYINTLKEENLKYKTKVSNLEKEASKFEKMIQENNASYFRDTQPAKPTDTHLSITLKQNVKELKTDLKKKEDELEEIKKVLKYTKIQELQSQMKAFQDEAMRLRTIMDHVMKEKTQFMMGDDDRNRIQEEYFIQATQLKTLQRDNEEMATAIKILEEQNFEYEKKISEQEKKYKREQNLHKKALQEKEKEMQKVKNETGGGVVTSMIGQTSPNQKRPVTSTNREDSSLKVELEKKSIENNNLINQLAEKRNQLLTVERQVRELRSEFNEKLTNSHNEKQALLRELEKLRNAKASALGEPGRPRLDSRGEELKLDDYIKRASLQATFTAEEKEKLQEYQSGSKSDKKQQFAPKKRVQKVRAEDIKTLSYEINLRLRLKRLTFEKIDRAIWSDRVRKIQIVTVKDMINVLKNDPFNFSNEDEMILMARYIVEDNEEEYLFYDENAKNDLTVVRSILKKVMGNLPLWDHENIKAMHEDIVNICVENYGGLRENLKVMCKSGFVTAKDIKDACDLIDVKITDEQVEYIIMKLFERSNDILKLSLEELFDIFSEKNRDLPDREEAAKDGSPQVRVNHEIDFKVPSLNKVQHQDSIKETKREDDDEDDDYDDSSPGRSQD